MELDGEGAANYEQLQDLICKKCDKHDRRYAQLEEKYNKLEHDVTHTKEQKNMAKWGCQLMTDQVSALKKNKSNPKQPPNQ